MKLDSHRIEGGGQAQIAALVRECLELHSERAAGDLQRLPHVVEHGFRGDAVYFNVAAGRQEGESVCDLSRMRLREPPGSEPLTSPV